MFKSIKKIVLQLSLASLFIGVLPVNAETYTYEGVLDEYSFEITYPTNWAAKKSGDDFQGVSPKSIKDVLLFEIREFKGKTYHEAIDFYINDEVELVEGKYTILNRDDGNILAREIVFQDTQDENKKFALTFVKRGLSVFVLSNPNIDGVLNYPYIESVSKVLESILDSFHFNDQYVEYIDYKSGYAFVYPKKFKKIVLDMEVVISNDKNFSFSVKRHENKQIKDLLKSTDTEKYIESSEIKLENGYRATIAVFKNVNDNKKFNKYLIQRAADIYELTAENKETNYPNSDYYTNDLKNIIASFEFFNSQDLGNSFFLDMPEDHTNIEAINYLHDKGIVNGFPNGAFEPNLGVNRAELVKMVVAPMQKDLSSYRACFPDVKDEWYASYICYAKEQGWVQGYDDGTFRPGAEVNRYEAIKIMLESLSDFNKPTDTVEKVEHEKNTNIEEGANILEAKEEEPWYIKYFNYAESNNLLDKSHEKEVDGKIDYFGELQMTRKEVAETVFRLLKPKENNLNLTY